MTDQGLVHSPEDRLMRHVEFDANGGCWLWSGCPNNAGYGSVSLAGREFLAHRVSYEAHVGPASGRLVLHKCDTPACINPAHLFLGSQQDNVDDMVRKGRAKGGSRPGETHVSSRLTDAQVREIRSSQESSRQLAKRMPVSDCMIRRIRRGLAWTHLQ